MTERAIDTYSLFLKKPKSLGANAIKKLRTFWNSKYNTNYTKITQFSSRLNKSIIETQKYLAENYNTFIENKKDARKSFLRQYNTQVKKSLVETNTPDYIQNKFNMKEKTFEFNSDPQTKVLLNLNKKYKTNVLTEFGQSNFELTKGLFLNTQKEIYNKLMNHTGDFNRILISAVGSDGERRTVSTKLSPVVGINEFYSKIDSVSQSASGASITDMTFTIQSRSSPVGAGLIDEADIPKFLIKRGIHIIREKENCWAYCFALADCKKNQDIKNLKKKDRYELWTKRALAIKKEMKIDNTSMSFVDAEIYANLRKRQVVILSELFQEIYKTENFYGDDIVYLYYDSNNKHYHFIEDVNSATNDMERNRTWCKCCNKSFLRINFALHKCKETVCGVCKVDFCDSNGLAKHFNKEWVSCNICNIWCANSCCLEKHSAICKGTVIKCNLCKKWVKNNHIEAHKCGEIFCGNCENYHFDKNHRCCIPVCEVSKKEHNNIWAYDFESCFDKNNTHIVNFAYCEQLNGDKFEMFENIEDCVKFMLKQKNITFVAHNGKAYDTWLIHKYIIKHTNKRPSNLILAGNKIMYMKIKSVRFIDSLNHIAQPLATFPDTFGLTEMKKGFFPYLFNVAENQNYIGNIPHIKFFSPNQMKAEKRAEFIAWYKEQGNVVYDFKKELREYCISDVRILKQALEIYIRDNLKENLINPLAHPTIASFDMKVFRTQHYNGNIAILKKEEYDFSKKGFFGGRTEVFNHKKDFDVESVRNGYYAVYQDICSLYPTVQFYDELPCGIPVMEINPEYKNIEEFLNNNFGYVECDVLCPQDPNIIPLLPERKDGKLMFDLAHKYNSIYTSVELKKAISLGYKITKIHKVLRFEKSTEIFKSYIRKFLKIKAEAGGYKGNNIDEYISKYLELGIVLEKDKIKSNKGLKLLAKNMLNNLWGKFGQKDEMPKTEYLDSSKWFRLLNRHKEGKVELKSETLIDEDTVYVQYIEKESDNTSLINTNVALAGFITAQARLRLYSQLEKIGRKRLLYCDTDSIVYIHDPTGYNIPKGDMLGEWEDETSSKEHPINPIIYWRALAPKSYGYKTMYGGEDVKCKGITLNFDNSRKFNHETLDKIITGKISSISTKKMEFVKDSKKGTITTKIVNKIISFDRTKAKSVIQDDYSTQPILAC